jgi:hypothetical protein
MATLSHVIFVFGEMIRVYVPIVSSGTDSWVGGPAEICRQAFCIQLWAIRAQRRVLLYCGTFVYDTCSQPDKVDPVSKCSCARHSRFAAVLHSP